MMREDPIMLSHIQYGLDLFFFPVLPVPIPWVPLLVCFVVAVLSPSRQLAQVRVGYLGFAFFALLVALFQIHLKVDGGEIFMAWGLFLGQFAVLAGLGVSMAYLVRSNPTLLALSVATAALAACQLLAFVGVLGASMNWIARLYVLTVLAAAAWRHRDWLSG
jgi:hypothetical protein